MDGKMISQAQSIYSSPRAAWSDAGSNLKTIEQAEKWLAETEWMVDGNKHDWPGCFAWGPHGRNFRETRRRVQYGVNISKKRKGIA